MKNIFNKFAFFIALSFVFISCGNLTTSENDDSIPQGKGKITISTDLQNGRSVLPTAITKDTTGLKWELVGTKDDTQQIIESWTDGTDETGTVTVTAYQSMTSGSGIVIDIGTWDFTLTASNTDGKNVLSATISTTINAGENKLNFVMQEATENAASGSIEFTLNFPKDVVDTVEAKLFKYENNDTEISNQTLSVEYSSTDNYSSVKYSYPDATGTTGTTSSPLSAGYYILKIELQQKKVDTTTPAVEPKTINTYSCLIRVAPGLLSKREYTLPDLAQLYTISYLDVITNDDGTTSTENATFDSTETITVTYNEYTSFELPTPTYQGHYFAGWYTDSELTNPVELDGNGKYRIKQDTILYAKWNKEVTGITHADRTLYISNYEGLCIFRDIVNGSLPMAITIPANESISGAKSLDWSAKSSGNWLSVELEKDIYVTDPWIPIGRKDASRDYGAIFDGNNHTITLSNGIDSDEYVALFSFVTGTIKNLVVEGEINSQGSNAVAGICACSYGGTFEHCVNKCIINSNTSSGTGGIVGYSNYDRATTIKSCVNMGEISSSLSTIGGIVGTANSSSDITIENSINLGKITGTSNVSGIFGLGSASTQKITDCINIGEIAVIPSDDALSTYAAGIICSSYNVIVSNCISVGNIINNTSDFQGAANFGAINYSSANGLYSNCYYDSSKINNPNDSNSSGINPQTTSKLCNLDSSILSNWLIDPSRYPLPNIVATDSSESISVSVWNDICGLAKVDTSSSGSSGTATGITYAGYESTYTTGSPKFYITTAEGLATFRNMVNGTVEGSITILKDESYTSTSASDYTVTSETASAAIYGELKNDIDLTNENWIPIGSSDRPFTGSFNGKNNTISNLNIKNATTDNQGLFGVIQGTSSSAFCTITSLVVEGNITSSACNVAGIAGKATFTKFENCVNKATVESTSTASNVAAAGIAGYVTNVKMNYCYNAGSITASMDVAGIAGYETASDTWKEYTYCINSGTITGGTNYSSIIGIANSKLVLGPCANYGKIISTTGNETGCIIGNCMTNGSDITQVSGILSVGPIETQGTYHVIANNVSITSSYYDCDVLSSDAVSGLDGYDTSNFIDDAHSMNLDTYRYTPGVYPIPDIEEYKISEAIWNEIIAAATPQNSGSSGIVPNAYVSTFSELKNAIESVTDTTTYTIDNPYLIGITSSFDTGTDITATTNVKSHIKLVAINSDGCTITKNASLAAQNIFTVAEGASLTLGGSNAVGELIIDGNNIPSSRSLINVSGTLVLNKNSTLQNSYITSYTNGGAVYSKTGTININGGIIKDNAISVAGKNGGGIYLENGTFNMTSGTFEGNSVSVDGNTMYGGALYLTSCTVNIFYGTFTSNSATNTGTTTTNTEFCGGAIYVIGSGTIDAPAIISNCSFNSNTAYQRGGAIYTGGASYININNSNFVNNTVTNGNAQGSAVYIGNTDGNIIIEDCGFSSNTTSDTIFTVYNGSTGGTHQVNGSDLSEYRGW